jgi:hypothetical protein
MRQANVCALAAFMMAASLMVGAQEVRKIDVGKLGPQVGATVPDFDLRDQHGKPWTLKSVMGPKGAMIVFFRSADW